MNLHCIDTSTLLTQVQGVVKSLERLAVVLKEANEVDVGALKAEIEILNKELGLRTNQRNNGIAKITRLNDLVYRIKPDDDQGETWMEYVTVLIIENLELRKKQGEGK